MHILKYLFLGLSLIGLVGLPGCASYRAHPLSRLHSRTSFPANEHGVFMSYKTFTATDCKRYLDRNVLVKGYQPVHITITNNSNRYLAFSKSNMSLPCVRAQEVARLVHTATTERVAAYGIAGVILLPIFWIPAIVDGIKSSRANEKLDMDFAKKSLRDQIINPFATVNGIVFVPVEDMDEMFSITLIDVNSRERFVLSSVNRLIQA